MRLWLSVCACVLVPVGGGPPARSPHASFARSGRSRSPARPCHRPPAPRPAPGVLHTSGAGCADDWLGVSSRSPARPCRRVACFVGPGRCVCRWAAARPRDRHTRAALGVVDLEARPGPAAAHRHRGRALLWFLRHYANPSNNERPGPQPHKQTLNNVRTRPVVQCLPMGRCAYPRLGLLVWAVHPIRRHYTSSVRVHRHITGAPPRNGCSATIAHRHRGWAVLTFPVLQADQTGCVRG